MDQAKKSISDTDEKHKTETEIDEKYKTKSEIDETLEEIISSFDKQYEEWEKWLLGKQSGSSSRHGTQFTDDDPLPTLNGSSSKKGRPKANCVETSSELPDHDIHGFINEALFLKNFLLKQKESKEFKTLAIVGKYGVGKTTLCQDVFNDEEVKLAYYPRIWVSMYSAETKEDEDPQIDVVKRILKSLGVEDERLEHIKTEAVDEKKSKEEAGITDEETVTEKELSELLRTLHLNLTGKKYMIVLDDVWEDNEWNQRLDLDEKKDQQKKTHLSCGFPKESGGRLIMTTRDERLAKEMAGEENMQHLFPRTDAESVLKIYSDAVKATSMIEVKPRYPGRFKQELMDKSCGIPLAARMLGRIVPEKRDESDGNMEKMKSS